MKKTILLSAALIICATIWAQVPQGITHQAVIRNAGNELVVNQLIGIQISILQGSAGGTAVYVETHQPMSNAQGLISYVIGQGTLVSGTFADIDWAAGPYFLKTEADPTGGETYTITGTMQFLSVPYALYAVKAEQIAGSISSNTLPPKAIAQTPVNIEPGMAVLSGIVNAEGFRTSVVFEWGKTIDYGNTIIADQSPLSGSSDMGVSALITDLDGLTEYHYRIKAENAVDVSISGNLSFVSDVFIPRINTLSVTDITPHSATSGGNVFHDGGSAVTERGIVWSTFPGPSIENNQGIMLEGSGTGVFHIEMTGLILGTTYYVRAFATNDLGTAYGEELAFTTGVPDVIFVSTYGEDSNPGSFNQPKQTIQAGINSAAQSGKDVYVAAGTYSSGTIFLANGVSIFGGYHPDTWEHNENHQVIISHDGSTSGDLIVGVQGIDIISNTVLDLLTIQTLSAGVHGISNYGIHLTNSGGLIIQDCTIIAGDGSDGADGQPGVDGLDGNDGIDGSPGDCDNDVPANGGPGGSSPIGRAGGQGGAGRYGNNSGYNGGNGQLVGSGGGQGGQGGTAHGCDGGGNGSQGQHANVGISGSHGSGGSGGNVSAGYWLSAAGVQGSSGTHGHGGGGGGGGGGQGGLFCVAGTGNGGGGGGAGGGGAFGAGGQGGGGSFGLFIVSSDGLQLIANTISSGNGGAGGAGGSGGCPGAGGIGGQGAAECLSDVGRGGNGGNGGNGGRGGHGGGGAGGPSYAIFLSDTSVDLAGNILNHGAAGQGGNAASKDCSIGGTTTGNAGSAGHSGNQN